MNITFFNPAFTKPDKLERIIEILRISEVFSTMLPTLENEQYLLRCGKKAFIYREPEKLESLEEINKRIAFGITNSIMYRGKNENDVIGWIVQDLYTESRSHAYLNNLKLGDPNILVLWHESDGDYLESKRLNPIAYAINILNKYGNIRYGNRFCIAALDPLFLMSDNVPIPRYLYYPVEFGYAAEENGWKALLALEFGLKKEGILNIAHYLLTPEGIRKREEREMQEKKEYEEAQELKRAQDEAQADADLDRLIIEGELREIREAGCESDLFLD